MRCFDSPLNKKSYSMLIQNYVHTLKQLLSGPGEVIDRFIKNDKGSPVYTHPFIFVLVTAVFITILNTLLVEFPSISINTGSIDEPVQAEEIAEWIEIVTIRFSTQFLPLMLYLLIPFLSLAGVFFLKSETEGFYSLLILNSYAAGVSMFVLPFMIPFWILFEESLSEPFYITTLPAILISFVIFGIYHLYFKLPGVIGVLKKASTLITGYLLFMLIKGLFAGITGYMLFALNRIRELSGS